MPVQRYNLFRNCVEQLDLADNVFKPLSEIGLSSGGGGWGNGYDSGVVRAPADIGGGPAPLLPQP